MYFILSIHKSLHNQEVSKLHKLVLYSQIERCGHDSESQDKEWAQTNIMICCGLV